jgi:hypothetical protein
MRLSEILRSSIDEGARFDSAVTTKALQKYCVENGWPAEVANNLSIQNDGSKYTVYYPPYLISKINDLEYGTQSTQPSGVLRRFLDTIDDSALATGILGAMF